MRRVLMDEYLLTPARYILKSGSEPGAPPCPYGNQYEWVGYDEVAKEYVRFSKSVFKKIKNMNEKLQALKVDTLVYLIESPVDNAEYNIDELKNELASRGLSDEALKKLLVKENEMIARMVLEQDDISNEEISIHKSHFLDEEEVRQIYINQLREYMQYKDGFRFDVWQYAMGGI